MDVPATGVNYATGIKAKAWGLWLDCLPQTEIAEQVGVTQQAVSGWLQDSANLREFVEPPGSRQHFDVWSFTTAAKAWGLWLDCLDAPDIAVHLGHVAADANADERPVGVHTNARRPYYHAGRRQGQGPLTPSPATSHR